MITVTVIIFLGINTVIYLAQMVEILEIPPVKRPLLSTLASTRLLVCGLLVPVASVRLDFVLPTCPFSFAASLWIGTLPAPAP